MAKAKTVTIELPETIHIESRGVGVDFDLSKVEGELAEFVAAAMLTGIVKTGIDSASGAKKYGEDNEITTEAATEELLNRWVQTRYKNGWARPAGEGMTALDRKIISLVRTAVKARDEQAYKDADESKRQSMCREYFAQLDEVKREGLTKHAQKLIDMAKKQDNALAELLGDVEV